MNFSHEFDKIIDGYWIFNFRSKSFCCSPDTAQLIGCDEKMRLNLEDFSKAYVHNDYRSSLKKGIRNLVLHKTDVLDTEIKIMTITHDWKWVRLRCKILLGKGHVAQLLGTITDVSKSKISCENIERERHILRTIIDNLPLLIYVIDNKGRKVLSNKTDYQIYGLNEESEVLGKTESELSPGPSGTMKHKNNLELIESKESSINRVEEFIDCKGNQRRFLTSKIPICYKKEHVSGLIGIGLDYTEQKFLQQRITESESFYRTLVEISPNGVLVTDLSAKIVYASRKLFEIYDVPEDTILAGESIFNWLSANSIVEAKKHFDKIINSELAGFPNEYLCLNYDKKEFWVEISSSPIYSSNRIAKGLMIVCRDITDRKSAQEDLVVAVKKAEENDKLKTAFLRNISHEIRTPLNAILGFSYLLGNKDLNEHKQRSYFEIINKSSDRLLKIINDIMEISNIEAGIFNIAEDEINLNELIIGLFNQLNTEYEKGDTLIEYSLGFPDKRIILRADRNKIIQIFSNLLNNALKFTSNGKIKFGYNMDKNVVFYVSDSGKGIPEDKFNRIFDRFYKLEDGAEKLYEGTGLGLSICREYVERMGGQIWLNSKIGHGTTFYFKLPIERLLN